MRLEIGWSLDRAMTNVSVGGRSPKIVTNLETICVIALGLKRLTLTTLMLKATGDTIP